MKKNRGYDSEFRNHVLELVENSNKKTSEIAKDLDIPVSTINTWISKKKRFKENAFVGKGNPRDRELYELKKELADVKMKRDILKKAINIFSKQNR